MKINAVLSFSITQFYLATWAVTPAVNGIPLTTLVTEFEREEQFDCLGGYGGLIPRYFNFGPLDRYYLGEFEPGSYYANRGRIDLLGCGDCGEVGCWPLECRVKIEGQAIMWHDFRQPHRVGRSYGRFGPFIFDLAQYKAAVDDLCADLAARAAAGRS